LVHAVVLGLLAFITLSNSRTPELTAVLGDFPAPEPVVKIDLPAHLPQFAETMRASSAGGRSGTAGPIAAGIETAPEQAARRVVSPTSAGQPLSPLDVDPRLPSKAELTASSLGIKLGKGLAVGGGSGRGVGDGEGNGSGHQFFELSTAGTKYVYVIDGSGSMTEPHKEARTKLDRVKRELIYSIGGLPFEMEFYVIFFNNHAVPMKAQSLQPATLDNKRKHLEWVAKIQGGGNTDPREALKLALGLKPDVIYLLTDGVFDPKVGDEVTKLNKERVSIHTFCFGNDSGESLLQNIARKNNGTYKFIP
jgi:SAM-dependent methyltransferase